MKEFWDRLIDALKYPVRRDDALAVKLHRRQRTLLLSRLCRRATEEKRWDVIPYLTREILRYLDMGVFS
jgi:hypothetical protein